MLGWFKKKLDKKTPETPVQKSDQSPTDESPEKVPEKPIEVAEEAEGEIQKEFKTDTAS